MKAKNRRQANAVLFDLDGTLLDSAPDLTRAANALLAEEGRAPIDVQALRPYISGGTRKMLHAAFGIKTNPLDMTDDDAQSSAQFFSRLPDYQNRFLRHYEAAVCVESTLFAGVPALLSTLEAKRIPWGIVTNKSLRLARAIMTQLQLDSRCACLIGGDSTPTPKPHPAPLLLAASTIGLPATEMLYLGDDPRDIEAGRAAGMLTIIAAWGYFLVNEDLTAWGADACIDTPEALLHWVA